MRSVNQSIYWVVPARLTPHDPASEPAKNEPRPQKDAYLPYEVKVKGILYAA